MHLWKPMQTHFCQPSMQKARFHLLKRYGKQGRMRIVSLKRHGILLKNTGQPISRSLRLSFDWTCGKGFSWICYSSQWPVILKKDQFLVAVTFALLISRTNKNQTLSSRLVTIILSTVETTRQALHLQEIQKGSFAQKNGRFFRQIFRNDLLICNLLVLIAFFVNPWLYHFYVSKRINEIGKWE